MKKLMIVMVISACLLLFTISIDAKGILPETYYNHCIAEKITKCIRIATMVNSKSECINSCAKTRDLQAKFFITHREELVQEMIAQKIEMKPYKVEYFLIKTFFDAHPQLASHATK